MMLDMTKKSPLAEGIKAEIFNRRRNYAIIITGKTQTRKSTVAIKLARDIQGSKFDLERQLASLKPENYLKVLNLDGLKRGSVLVLDEFGVGMDHRSWYTFLNKALNYVMQTHGFRGWTIIVTTPYAKYVDSDARMLFDMMITTLKKNDKKGFVYCKVEELQYNQKLDTMYYKYPRGRFPDGSVKRLDAFRIKYPPKEVMDSYFKTSDADKKTLAQDMETQVKKIQKEQTKGLFDPKIYAEQVVDSIKRGETEFVKEWHGRVYIPLQALKIKFGFGDERSREIKYMAEKIVYGASGGKKI